jgi:gluconate kinase
MALIYITGASGAGKSTVRTELQRRGYPAYDSDEDRLARWFSNATGDEVPMPARRDDDWFASNTYRLPPETVRRIAAELGDSSGFLCGTVGNDNEIWDLFAAVISLSIDEQTLRRRLAARANGFGSTDAELQRVLAWHTAVDADNQRYGAILVDAARPITEVVDDLLTRLRLPNNAPRR